MTRLYMLILAGVLCLLSQPALAAIQDCTITWNPNTEADLAGYRVYVAPTSRGYTKTNPTIDVQKSRTTAKCSELGLTQSNTYYFAVTAYDTTGNVSEFSNELQTFLADIVSPDLAYVTTLKTDLNGADVAIVGPAAKLFVASDTVSLREVPGFVPGSLTYRFSRRWVQGDTFVCFIAENARGTRTEQRCNTVPVGPSIDTEPPAAPIIKSVVVE